MFSYSHCQVRRVCADTLRKSTESYAPFAELQDLSQTSRDMSGMANLSLEEEVVKHRPIHIELSTE